MSTPIYVDTNIWMDFLLGRDKRAEAFFVDAVNCLYNIIITDVVLAELNRKNLDATLLFAVLESKQKLQKIMLNEEDKDLAKDLPTHTADSWHAAIALRLSVPILTQNKKDFIPINNLEVLTYNDIKR